MSGVPNAGGDTGLVEKLPAVELDLRRRILVAVDAAMRPNRRVSETRPRIEWDLEDAQEAEKSAWTSLARSAKRAAQCLGSASIAMTFGQTIDHQVTEALVASSPQDTKSVIEQVELYEADPPSVVSLIRHANGTTKVGDALLFTAASRVHHFTNLGLVGDAFSIPSFQKHVFSALIKGINVRDGSSNPELKNKPVKRATESVESARIALGKWADELHRYGDAVARLEDLTAIAKFVREQVVFYKLPRDAEDDELHRAVSILLNDLENEMLRMPGVFIRDYTTTTGMALTSRFAQLEIVPPGMFVMGDE